MGVCTCVCGGGVCLGGSCHEVARDHIRGVNGLKPCNCRKGEGHLVDYCDPRRSSSFLTSTLDF